MDEIPARQYTLPRELVSAAGESQAALRKIVEHVDGGYLVVRNVPLIEGEISATDLYWFLSPIARHRAFDSIELNERAEVPFPVRVIVRGEGVELLNLLADIRLIRPRADTRGLDQLAADAQGRPGNVVQ